MPVVYPTPLTGTAVKLVVMTNYLQWGWSDVFYYNCTQNTSADQWMDILNMARQVAAAIDGSTGTGASVVAARASILGPSPGPMKAAGQSNLYSRAALAIPDLAGQGPPESPWAACLFRVATNDFTLDRPWLFRGAPALATQKSDAAGGFNPPLNTTLTNIINLLQARIFGNAALAGSPPRNWSGQICMKAQVRNPSTAPFAEIQAIGSTGNPGYFKYTILTADDPVMSIGSYAVVRGVRIDCGKGGSGTGIVRNVQHDSPSAGLTTYTLNKRWCCNGDPVPKSFGTIGPLVYGLFPLTQLTFERFVKRDTGGVFLGTRGRQRSKCCS